MSDYLYKRIRRKRNFIIHALIYIALSAFFFFLNFFTYNSYDGWWFMFPMIPLGFVLSLHLIFTIGKDYAEMVAYKWESKFHEEEIEYLPEPKNDRLELEEMEERLNLLKEFKDRNFV